MSDICCRPSRRFCVQIYRNVQLSYRVLAVGVAPSHAGGAGYV